MPMVRPEEVTMADVEEQLTEIEERLAGVASAVPAELRRHVDRSRAEVMFALACLADR